MFCWRSGSVRAWVHFALMPRPAMPRFSRSAPRLVLPCSAAPDLLTAYGVDRLTRLCRDLGKRLRRLKKLNEKLRSENVILKDRLLSAGLNEGFSSVTERTAGFGS